MNNIWNEFKQLKWYWKILAIIPVLLILGVVIFYAFINGNKDINLKLLNLSKEKTDNRVKEFHQQEDIKELERKALEKKQDSLEEKVIVTEEQIKQKEKENEEVLWKIDNANSPDQLRALFADLRERGGKS